MNSLKYLAFIFFFLVLACGTDEQPVVKDPLKYSITSITPLRGKIGDTITIKGNNLKALRELYFTHVDEEYYNVSKTINLYAFISQTDDEIVLKIPYVYHENMRIEFLAPFTSEFELEVVGMIGVKNEFNTIGAVQIIDENTAYLSNGNKILKSTDGYYKWETVYECPQGLSISSFFFLDELNSWVGLHGENENSLYYSNDGGYHFNFKFKVDDGYGGSSINKIQFTSLQKGFFVNNVQKMFVTDNETFQDIYSYYPQLDTLPFGKVDIWTFNAINENLIFLTASNEPYLLKIDNQNMSYSELDAYSLSYPVFFDNIGYFHEQSYIYKSTDSGDSWQKLKTFDNRYSRMNFLNAQEGYAFVPRTPEEMHLTKDGGVTWEKYFTFPQYTSGRINDFKGDSGLLADGWGNLFKYRKE